jgi:hypothetical protein
MINTYFIWFIRIWKHQLPFFRDRQSKSRKVLSSMFIGLALHWTVSQILDFLVGFYSNHLLSRALRCVESSADESVDFRTWIGSLFGSIVADTINPQHRQSVIVHLAPGNCYFLFSIFWKFLNGKLFSLKHLGMESLIVDTNQYWDQCRIFSVDSLLTFSTWWENGFFSKRINVWLLFCFEDLDQKLRLNNLDLDRDSSTVLTKNVYP